MQANLVNNPSIIKAEQKTSAKITRHKDAVAPI